MIDPRYHCYKYFPFKSTINDILTEPWLRRRSRQIPRCPTDRYHPCQSSWGAERSCRWGSWRGVAGGFDPPHPGWWTRCCRCHIPWTSEPAGFVWVEGIDGSVVLFGWVCLFVVCLYVACSFFVCVYWVFIYCMSVWLFKIPISSSSSPSPSTSPSSSSSSSPSSAPLIHHTKASSFAWLHLNLSNVHHYEDREEVWKSHSPNEPPWRFWRKRVQGRLKLTSHKEEEEADLADGWDNDIRLWCASYNDHLEV